ncbi:MAG: DUF952 domain-containing protein [Planctomycetes bacterium]|nr:DUF952 domain-containing protein [Planctomycetota bacterium]
MPSAFLLVESIAWESFQDEVYYPPNYDSEGFIHLSYNHQLEWAANKFYAKAKGVLALEINLGQLGSFVKKHQPRGWGCSLICTVDCLSNLLLLFIEA